MLIVPIPCASEIVALIGALRLTEKVSFASAMKSPLTVAVSVVVPVAPPPAIELTPANAAK